MATFADEVNVTPTGRDQTLRGFKTDLLIKK